MPKGFVSVAIPYTVWERLIKYRIKVGKLDSPLYKTIEELLPVEAE